MTDATTTNGAIIEAVVAVRALAVDVAAMAVGAAVEAAMADTVDTVGMAARAGTTARAFPSQPSIPS